MMVSTTDCGDYGQTGFSCYDYSGHQNDWTTEKTVGDYCRDDYKSDWNYYDQDQSSRNCYSREYIDWQERPAQMYCYNENYVAYETFASGDGAFYGNFAAAWWHG